MSGIIRIVRINDRISSFYNESLEGLPYDDVLDFYGLDGNATIMWTDMQVGDFATQVASYENAVKNFLMSPEEAMKRLYPNKTKREMVKLQEEVQRNRENIVNTYYGGVNENNTLKEKGDNNLESKEK